MEIPQLMIETLVSAIQEVFETMVFCPVAVQPVMTGDHAGPTSGIVASVGFAGQQCGVVAFYSGTDAAGRIAGAMLGLPPAEVTGEMPDAIGEMANMIAGTFRTKMAAYNQAWAISVPTVTIGSDFQTRYGSAVSRAVVPFEIDGHGLFVELVLHG